MCSAHSVPLEGISVRVNPGQQVDRDSRIS